MNYYEDLDQQYDARMLFVKKEMDEAVNKVSQLPLVSHHLKTFMTIFAEAFFEELPSAKTLAENLDLSKMDFYALLGDTERYAVEKFKELEDKIGEDLAYV